MTTSDTHEAPNTDSQVQDSDPFLLAMIDDEVSWSEKKFGHKGINQWALAGALASLVWIFFEQVINDRIIWNDTICFTVLLYFIYKLYDTSKIYISKYIQYYYLRYNLTVDTVSQVLSEDIDYVYSSFITTAILGVACYCTYSTLKYEFILFVITLVYMTFVVFLVFAFSKFYFISFEYPNKVRQIGLLLFIIAIIALIYHVLIIIASNNLSIFQVKYSFIVIGIFICLEQLANISKHSLDSNRVTSLHKLKQDILLNKINNSINKSSYEFITRGPSVPQYIFMSCGDLTQLNYEFMKHSDELEKLYDQRSAKPNSELIIQINKKESDAKTDYKKITKAIEFLLMNYYHLIFQIKHFTKQDKIISQFQIQPLENQKLVLESMKQRVRERYVFLLTKRNTPN